MNDELELADKGGWWENRNKNATLILVFVVMLAAKLLTMLLPAKYFYDNNRILGMANEDVGVHAWAGTYIVAANFFKNINVFSFTTMSQWSWFLGLSLTLVVFFMVLRLPEPDMVQTIFLLSCIGLLNIYVFNIGKDVIQFLFFMAVYLVLLIPIENSFMKIVLAAVVLYFESKVFRSYYILIAAFVLAIYCILVVFRKIRRIPPAAKIAITVATMYLLVCAMMVVASVLMPDEYQQIMDVRDYSLSGREGDADSVTIIKNWVGGDNSTSLPLFLLNYLINAVRMMIPFELVFSICRSASSKWLSPCIWCTCSASLMRSRMTRSSWPFRFSWAMCLLRCCSNRTSDHGSVMKRPHSLYCICWCSPRTSACPSGNGMSKKSKDASESTRTALQERMSDARRFFLR